MKYKCFLNSKYWILEKVSDTTVDTNEHKTENNAIHNSAVAAQYNGIQLSYNTTYITQYKVQIIIIHFIFKPHI